MLITLYQHQQSGTAAGTKCRRSSISSSGALLTWSTHQLTRNEFADVYCIIDSKTRDLMNETEETDRHPSLPALPNIVVRLDPCEIGGVV
jgi:hypothetical protein